MTPTKLYLSVYASRWKAESRRPQVPLQKSQRVGKAQVRTAWGDLCSPAPQTHDPASCLCASSVIPKASSPKSSGMKVLGPFKL